MNYYDILLAKKLEDNRDPQVVGLSVTENGTYSEEGKVYKPVVVNVPLPSNAYLLKSIENESIATFADGTDNFVKSLEVAIEPVQSGSGEPSPTNIRPIIGWDECKVTRCGKNLFDKTAIENNKWLNVTTGEIESSNGYAVTAPIKVEANQTIIMSNPQSSRRWFYDINGNAISLITSNTFTPSQDGYIRLTLALNNVNLDTFQVEFGNQATTYEPYNGTTYTIDLDGTRYGGKLDVVNGIVTPAPYYASYNGEALTGEWISDRDKYEVGTTPTIGAQVVNIGASGTPVSILPTAIKSLQGDNNFFADSGEIELLQYFGKETA